MRSSGCLVFKKILLVLLLFLTSCTKKEEEPVITKEEYIDPAKDIFIFDKIDGNLASRIKDANAGKDFKNYQFMMLYKDIYDGVLEDINGNKFRLSDYDQVILEIVSVECSHCRRQLGMLEAFMAENEVPFVQYFNVGTKDEIVELYEEEDMTIPDDIIIVAHDDGLNDYLKKTLQIKTYPTTITFKDDKVTFAAEGEIDLRAFRRILNIGFTELISEDDLKDENGVLYTELSRSIDEVRNDISDENLKKLKALDNDDYSEELTLKLMGKKLDFNTFSNPHSELYRNDIGDFSAYEDERLVLIYTYLKDSTETEKVRFINELMDENSDVRYIVVLIEGMDSSSAALNGMSQSFNCPVVSVLGYMPDDFFGFGIIAYPTAVFVDKGTFTGAYSNIESPEKFKTALELFLSDECIAYKRNNQISKG